MPSLSRSALTVTARQAMLARVTFARSCLLVALVTLVIAAPARGDYSGQRPAAPVVQVLVGQAAAWWADNGVGGCDTGVVAWQAPDLDDASGRGADCSTWFADDLVATTHLPTTRRRLLVACGVAAHEVGHALGLPHTAAGVMAERFHFAPVADWAPVYCHEWAAHRWRLLLRRAGWHGG